MKPHAPGSFALHLTIGHETYDKLQYVQALLSHSIPSGDLAEVLDRTLDVAIAQLEKRKFGATDMPRPRSSRSSTNPRYIPAEVKRAVRERDQGQCTFVGENGHRCASRRFLEFDHIDPVPRGGQATVENVRLRCRAHNQHEAERIFGAGFMEEKRERAAEAAAATAAAEERTKDIICGLRNLGFRAEQARRAAEHCATLPEATLEEHLRAAIKYLCPKRTQGRVGTSLQDVSSGGLVGLEPPATCSASSSP